MTEFPFNPFDPSFKVSPYQTFENLRKTDPVYKSPLGFYVLSEYDDVKAVLKDKNASPDADRALEESGAVFREELNVPDELDGLKPFLFMDPPDHTRLRSLVSMAFTPKMVEGLRPTIAKTASDLIELMLEKQEVDLVESFAFPLPVAIICKMLGVPNEDEQLFKGWSNLLARSLDPGFMLPAEIRSQRLKTVIDFKNYFKELISYLRKHPQDDLLSKLIDVEASGEKLSEVELIGIAMLLLIAGHETTVSLIANSVLALIKNKDQERELRQNRELIKLGIEEVLRYDPPVQLTGRYSLSDIALRTTVVDKGSFIVLLIAAANRDPKQFSNPDEFDVHRSPNNHLSFGFGSHFCLGAPLARLETQVALELLLERVKFIELLDSHLEYKDNIVLRGLKKLLVTLS